jgi:hypothetical protein
MTLVEKEENRSLRLCGIPLEILNLMLFCFSILREEKQ